MRAFIRFFAYLVTLGTLVAQVAPEVEKYHQMLLKRPQAGILYDRFYAAWLETGSTDELAAFLTKKAEAAEALAADQLILAFFHEQQGDETAALNAFKAALVKDADNSSAWVQRAKLEARILDFTAALTSLAEGEKNKPSSDLQREIGTLRGRWLLRTGKPEPALQAWRDLLKLNEDDDDLAEEVIELQLEEGLYGEAEAQMTALISRTKDAYERTLRQLRLAEIMIRSGKKEEALKAIADTLSATGQGSWIEGEVLAQLEAIFRRDENLTGLSTRLAELSAAHPQRVALQKAEARVLAELGEKDKALALFAAILKKTPGERELRESYLALLEQFEKFQEGIEQTEVLLTQAPNDRELLIRLATLQERAKNPSAAKATLDKYIATEGTTEFDHLRVARLYEGWEHQAEATTAYEIMAKAFPESAAAKEAQAHYLHRLGKKEVAIGIWRDLAKAGDLIQLIAVGQALMTRNESEATVEVLQGRATEFAQNERYLGILVNAALAAKKDEDALKWALARVRAIQDLNLLDDALRQIVIATEKEGRLEKTIAELMAQASLGANEKILLATLLEESGDLVGSEKALRDMIPENALAAQTRLQRLMESRQDWLRAYDEAQKLLTTPGGRTSNNVQRLAELAERNGKSDEALKYIADWKTLSPGSVQPWLSEARLLRLNGKVRESLQLLRSAVRKFEDDEAVADTLATAYAELGQLTDAERIYLSRYEESEKPEDKMRWVASLARMASERGQLKALTEKFQERQRTNRSDAAPWLALAEIHRISANTTEQERALREAARLRPDDIELAQKIARLDLDMGQWKRALETLERVKAKDRGTRIKQLMASIQIECGDENTGYRQLYEMAGGDKMDADDALTLVKSITTKQDWERAAAFLEPLVRQHPLDYRLGYLLAVSLEENGKSDEAARLFTRLVTQKEEYPGAKAATKDPNQAAIDKEFAKAKKMMPQEALDFLRVFQMGGAYQAYDYRQNRMFGRSSNSAVKAPQTVDALGSYSSTHLISVINELPPEQASAQWAAGKSAGIQNTEILALCKIGQYGNLEFSPPEDSDLAKESDGMIALRQTFVGSSGKQPVEISQHAFERFRERYPLLSFQAAVALVQADAEKGMKAFEEALTRFEKLSANEGVFGYSYFISSLLGGGQSMKENADLVKFSSDVKERLLALLTKVLDHKEPSEKARASASAVPNFLNAVREQEAWDLFVTLLEREVRLFKTEPVTAKQWATTFTSRVRNQPKEGLKPLAFPFHPDLPPTLRAYFMHPDPYNPRELKNVEPEPEAFKEMLTRLDKITLSALQAVLAYKAGDEKRAVQEITAPVQLKEASLNDLLFAASWFGLKEDHAQAAGMLVRASQMQVPATSRAEVDSALVHAIISAQAKDKPEWTEPAQMALRRLRSGRISAEQKEELLTAMKAVGLSEEAEQWAKIASAAPSTASSSSRSYSSSSGPDTVKLKQLLGSKDEAAIAKEAVVQLKRCISYASNGNASYAASRAKEIMRLISAPTVLAKVHAAFEVGPDASVTKLMEYVQYLETTAQQNKAKAVLEALVERDPKLHEARLKLCAAVAAKEPERAVKLLQSVPLSAYQKTNLGDQILRLLSDQNNLAFEARMNIASTLAELLASAPTTNGSVQGLDWLIDLPGHLANNTYKSPRLPHLAWRPGQDNGYDEAYIGADAPEAVRRRQVFERICQALMKHPLLAEEGFRKHAMLWIHEKKSLDELSTLANQLILALKPVRQKPQPSRRSYYFQDITGLWAPSPQEFMVWYAWKQNKADQIEKTILPLAAECLNNTALKILRAQTQVWTCPAEDFAKVGKLYMTANAGTMMAQNYGGSALSAWLADRWQERNLSGTPLDDLQVSFLKSENNYSGHYGLTHYMQIRAELRPEADKDAFLQQVLTAALGKDSTKWGAQMKLAIDSRYGNGGSYNSAYQILETVDSCLRTPATFSQGIKLAALTGALADSRWSNNNSSNFANAAKSPKTAIPALKALGLLGEADQFTIALGSNSAHNRVLGGIVGSTDTRADMRSTLASLQPKTFGSEFMLALTQDSVGPSLAAVLKRRAADLVKVPESSRAGLSQFIKSQILSLSNLETADKDLVKALEPLLAEEIKKSATLVETWLAAKQTKEIESDDRAYDEKVIATMKSLVLTDPAKARALFLKASELTEAKSKTGKWEGNNTGNGWSTRSSYLDGLAKVQPKLETIAFVLRQFHEDSSGQLSCDGWAIGNGYGSVLMEVWKQNGGGGAMGQGIDGMLKKMAEVMKDTPPTLLALVFYDFFSALPQAKVTSALKHASQVPASQPNGALAKELDFAGRFFLSTHADSRGKANLQKTLEEVGGMTPAWEHYRAALKNTQQSARIRQALGHHLAHYTLGRIDPECAKLAAAAALESQKAKHCLHGYQYGWILHGFNQLPVDDAWKIAAQEHWDAWAARNANGGLSKYGPHDWAVNSMLRMVARSGNEDWARTMLSQFHETLSNEQSGVASLVMGGMPKLAAEHFKTEWRGFFVNAQNEILWSQEIQANLHAFKQACADPGLAMLGELYLSHLKDPAKPDQEAIPGFKNKETRLKEIAAHFKEITFTDPELRKECVELICMDYDAAAIIQDVAEEVGIATDLEQIGSYENTLEHGQQCKPLQFALGMKAARGENQPAIAAFDKALAVSFNSTYYHRNLLKEVSSGPVHVSQWQWAQEFKADKPSKTKELLLFLEHVITKTPANLRDNHVTDCVSLKWLIHLIHQDAAAFDAWQKSLKPTDLKELASSVGDNWQIWSFLQGYALPANKERLKPEERLLLITSVLKNSWTQEKYPGSGPGIPNLIIDLIQKAKLFKPDEFVAVAVPISEALPRAGRTAVEAGDYLVAQGKSKEAVAMYALAVSHAQKEKPTDYGLAGGFAIKQIETLENTQQRPEALKALKALDPKRLGGGNKKIYETALKRLSSPAAETSK